jgi:hypothetical protein
MRGQLKRQEATHPRHAATHVLRALLHTGKYAVDRHHHNSHVKKDKKTGAATRCSTDYACDGANQNGAFASQNTESSEQTFSFLHKYASTVGRMGESLHMFFLAAIVYYHNRVTTRSHALAAAKAAFQEGEHN